MHYRVVLLLKGLLVKLLYNAYLDDYRHHDHDLLFKERYWPLVEHFAKDVEDVVVSGNSMDESLETLLYWMLQIVWAYMCHAGLHLHEHFDEALGQTGESTHRVASLRQMVALSLF